MFVPVRPMTINMDLRQRGCVGDMDSQLLDRRRAKNLDTGNTGK